MMGQETVDMQGSSDTQAMITGSRVVPGSSKRRSFSLFRLELRKSRQRACVTSFERLGIVLELSS